MKTTIKNKKYTYLLTTCAFKSRGHIDSLYHSERLAFSFKKKLLKLIHELIHYKKHKKNYFYVIIV